MRLSRLQFYLSIGFFALCTLIGCKNEGQQKNVNATTEIQDASLDKYLTSFIGDKDEIAAIKKILGAFDKKLCKGFSGRSKEDCYLFHAKEMKDDFMQKRPFTIAVPYDGSISLSQFAESGKLNFLSDKCGFQVQDTVVNYLCFKSQGPYLDKLKEHAVINPLISSFVDMYQTDKTIHQGFRQQLLMESDVSFDFSDSAQRMFYAYLHLIVQEEILAEQKVKVLSQKTID